MMKSRTFRVGIGASLLCSSLVIATLGMAPAQAQDEVVNNTFFYYSADALINSDIHGNDVVIGRDHNGNNFGTTSGTKITVTVGSPAVITKGFGVFFGLGTSVFNQNALNIVGGNIGGNISGVFGYDDSTTTVSGGSVYEMQTDNNASLNISGGTVNSAAAFGSSSLTISNGTVNFVNGLQNSTVAVSGGTISRIQGFGSSVITITGGSITDINGDGTSTIDLSGGTISTNTIRLFSNSVINITGSGLGFVGNGTGSDGFGTYTDYLLSGTLQGGQSIAGVHLFDYRGGYDIVGGGPGATPLYFNGNAQFTAASAAPEPASIALLALAGGIGFGVRRARERGAKQVPHENI